MKFQKVGREMTWTAPVVRVIAPTDIRVQMAIATDPALAAAVHGIDSKKTGGSGRSQA